MGDLRSSVLIGLSRLLRNFSGRAVCSGMFQPRKYDIFSDLDPPLYESIMFFTEFRVVCLLQEPTDNHK